MRSRMKKVLTRLLTGTMAFSLALSISSCAPTKSGSDVQSGPSGDGTTTSDQSLDVIILTASAREKDANLIRDLLSKAGFNPILNIQPDFASVSAIRATGNWDIAVGAWTISPGNADYALRPLFTTGAPSNSGGLADPVLDEMIDDAAATDIDAAWDKYAEIEKYMVEDHAYVVTLYGKTKNQAVNKNVIVPESAVLYANRSNGILSHYEYVDPSEHETRPLNLTSIEPNFTSYWLPRHNETYSAYFTDNMYVTLITRDPDGTLSTDRGLAYNYAATESNDEFYFILRDNITYARVEDKKAVDTGVKVSADDVVFSLMNAKC